MTWEYRVVSLNAQDHGEHDPNTELALEGSARLLATVRERLGDLGGEGWELIGSHVLTFGAPTWVMVFKRPGEHRVIL